MNILTHFLEFNTRMMPDFLFVKYKKKKNIKFNFEKDRLNLLNMRRKINKKGKDKIICTLWKNWTIFTRLIGMASHLYNLLQLFSEIFDEI